VAEGQGPVRIVSCSVGEHRHAPPNADQTLQTVRFKLSTGNNCDITPSMRRVGEELRVIFVQCWLRAPSPEEMAAITACLNHYFGRGPGEVSAVMSLDQGAATAEHWLSGRKPQ
jgi:hypothetical protein